jgi:hypothetical protein
VWLRLGLPRLRGTSTLPPLRFHIRLLLVLVLHLLLQLRLLLLLLQLR